jgi:hypothetical protein
MLCSCAATYRIFVRIFGSFPIHHVRGGNSLFAPKLPHQEVEC